MNARLDCPGVGRYSAELEATVYFCCAKALRQAERGGAAEEAVVIELTESQDELRFDISYAGTAFERAGSDFDSRLREITDCVEALGGDLRMESPTAGGRAQRVGSAVEVSARTGTEPAIRVPPPGGDSTCRSPPSAPIRSAMF